MDKGLTKKVRVCPVLTTFPLMNAGLKEGSRPIGLTARLCHIGLIADSNWCLAVSSTHGMSNRVNYRVVWLVSFKVNSRLVSHRYRVNSRLTWNWVKRKLVSHRVNSRLVSYRVNSRPTRSRVKLRPESHRVNCRLLSHTRLTAGSHEIGLSAGSCHNGLMLFP